MKIEMKFKAEAVCPKDGQTITMDVQITAQKFLLVEDVLAKVATITAEPIFQEAFTECLRSAIGQCTRKLTTGTRTWDVSIVTRGIHSGVEITCAA